jgi:hypothetical protein
MIQEPLNRSPLARLILFMICLSLAGTLVAGVYWSAVELPQQKAQSPANGGSDNPRNNCIPFCKAQHCISYVPGEQQCDDGYAACLARC